MKIATSIKLFIIALIIAFGSFLQAQNVIIVVMDGARYSETFGAGSTYIPHLYTDMKPLGTLYTNFGINYPSGYTETCPGHSAVESGTWQPIANDGSERPTKPTVFEYMRKELGSPQSDCYAVTGKTKLNILTYSTDPGYGSDYGGTWVGDDNRNDSQTYSKVINVLDAYHPRLLVINFAQVDAAGHAGNWNNYLSAITNADSYIYQLWQHIEAGDYGYTPQNTTVFVTNDHGRHDDGHGGFTNHGDGCEGCTHIMLLALGRGVSINQTLDFSAWQRDIAPTVGDLLGFQTPEATGTSLFDYPNPIPVELVNFTAGDEGNSVLLSWSTATEKNNRGFEIQRKSNNEWETISFIAGKGNATETTNYQYTDNPINSGITGKVVYRLKQIDFDGTIKYSDVVEIRISAPEEYRLGQNFPNPFNPATIINYQLPAESFVSIKVFNILGKEVATLVNEKQPAGHHSVQFDAAGQPNGVYLYRINSGNFSQVKKMVLLK